MLTQLLAIARNAFVESVRQPIYFVLVFASGVLQVANNLLSTYSMGYSDSSEVSGDDKLFLDIGLSTILVCLTLLAAFIATSVLSREIEQKTALTVVSKPVARPLFVLGKYLGVSGAMLVATVAMLMFFLLSLQHGVMSRATDTYDMPVMVFGFGAAAVGLFLAVWGNYFYGWVFPSSAVLFTAPLLVLAWIITLFMDGNWIFQGFMYDLKPQIMLACFAVGMSMLVLTAVAVAASTRLGQVMTIVVCLGVFLFGLLSNYLVGRRAFENPLIERIALAEALADADEDFSDAGDRWSVRLDREPRNDARPGDSFYYGSDPSGIALVPPAFEPFDGDVGDERDIVTPPTGPALIVLDARERTSLTVVNAGGLRVDRPPRAGDYMFASPTRSNWPARIAWSVAPNFQFYWLVDAITQTHPIPGRYLLMLLGYTAAQVTALLAIGVALFQTREVG